jgi:SAM-dependent methyltransferase
MARSCGVEGGVADHVVDHRGDLDARALDAHDHQKDWPEDLWSTLVEGLRPHLTPCLEVGAGSGLVALRLTAAATRVIGLDFNGSMLGRLRQRAPEVPAIQGDALHLPVARGRVGSAVVSNVLHLIPDWRRVLSEVADAVELGGRVLVNLGAGGTAPPQVADVRRRFLSYFDDLDAADGPASDQELDDALGEVRFQPIGSVTASGTTHRSLRDVIERLEHNPFAWPAGVSRQRLTLAADEVRAYALERFGTIDEQLEHQVRVRFAIYERT